jgi:superoxide dismutase, Cu-Zn family
MRGPKSPRLLEEASMGVNIGRTRGTTILAVGFAALMTGAVAKDATAAKSLKVTINLIDANGVGKSVGTVTVTEGKDGVTLVPNLKGLPPGEHGFHLHENPSCASAEKDGVKTAGEAAGAHYDPGTTKAHKGPEGGGHKGDLPKLVVSEKGEAAEKMQVKGVGLADFRGRAMMVHAGGDNYRDSPKPSGGGGERIACGVIK